MGLDNGIYVKSKKRQLTREDLPKGIVFPFEKDYGEAPEILYWRKNWGLRNQVLNTLGTRLSNDYISEIDTVEQVIDIMKVIIYFMDEETWESEGDSIWSYKEELPVLRDNILNLALIAAYMKDNPDVYLEFYDSY